MFTWRQIITWGYLWPNHSLHFHFYSLALPLQLCLIISSSLSASASTNVAGSIALAPSFIVDSLKVNSTWTSWNLLLKKMDSSFVLAFNWAIWDTTVKNQYYRVAQSCINWFAGWNCKVLKGRISAREERGTGWLGIPSFWCHGFHDGWETSSLCTSTIEQVPRSSFLPSAETR